MEKTERHTGLVILMLLAMTAWGGSWTSAKLIAHLAEPEVIVFWRFLFTFVAFLPVMLIFRESFQIRGTSLLQVFLGAVFIVSYNKFFFTGLRYGLAGAGGVLVTTLNPILTFLMVLLLFRQRITFKEAL
ncbi:MAG: DMT family transporter, partial [bacterium]